MKYSPASYSPETKKSHGKAAHESGLSITQYCEDNSLEIPVNTVRNWTKRHRRENGLKPIRGDGTRSCRAGSIKSEREQHVRDFKASGMTRSAYSAKHGIGYAALCKWVQQSGEVQSDFEDGLLDMIKKPAQNLKFMVTLSIRPDHLQTYEVVGSSSSTIEDLKDLAVNKMLDDIEVKSVVLI